MSSLFCYGTLQIPMVMAKVIQRIPEGKQARIAGMQAVKFSGKSYPGIQKSAGNALSGVIYSDINEKELQALDQFEGGEYFRDSIRATNLESGTEETCFIYKVKPEYLKNLSPTPWRLKDFLINDIDDFMVTYP